MVYSGAGSDKQIRWHLMIIKGEFTSFLNEYVVGNIEISRHSNSNEYPQQLFYGEIWKIIPKISSNILFL